MKEKTVLDFLQANKERYISGQQIGDELGMTRANVWKEIEKLRKQGMEIASVRNKGYQLVSANNILSVSGIQHFIDHETTLKVYETLSSSNDTAKQYANESHDENVWFISDEQTKGKGRQGRSFYSPKGNGIYMSVVLRPDLSLENTQLLTILAAVALTKALKKELELDVDIKWLNDIFIQGKKMAGILTEGEIILELKKYKYIVLGMGLNVYQDKNLPDELSDIYTSLEEHTNQTIHREKLIAMIINEFNALLTQFPDNVETLLHDYEEHCFVIGQEVYVNDDTINKYKVTGITPQGHLVVEDSKGQTSELFSGEISIGGYRK
ncbi:biotin--[acetyl-CoA-carboxylase] ligase [Erysipelothrix urinaevulpis]|uniref:biotin--[acetyl-CoA-carboxylase] ligase n=1 Tax=Erysipelothrix urinaevulpis TaxID=2683717 RepID=UPI001357091F|nr:biotin--[acetyl-CoA-carboxylase] ligase [Erysipelothrix urinaevulpis]